MPNVHDVQLLHGPSEVGKDIVFKAAAPFEQTLQCACIVKNVPLVGNITSAGSAQTALTQARQALANDYVSGSGQLSPIHRVYVISSCAISAQAIASTAGELREKSGQVQFIAGDELARLFLKYWPDFFADEAAAMQTYIRELEAVLVQQKELSQLARMYPSAGFGENRVLNYVPTRLRFRAIDDDVDSYIESVVTTELGPQPISLIDLGNLERKLTNRKAFLQHINRFDSRPPLTVPASVQIETFIADLHDRWLRAAKPQRRLFDPELSDAERRPVSELPELNERLKRINQATQFECSELKTALREGRRFLQVKEHTVAVLKDPAFLRYCNAVDCLRAYDQKADFAEQGSELLHIEFDQEDVLALSGVKLIVAPVGYGKTSLCRWRALNDIKHLRSGDSTDVPFYIRLTCVDPTELQSASKLLRHGSQSALLSAADWRAVQRGEANVRVYLDGLDEIGGEEERKAVISAARTLAKRHPAWRILVTSRDYVHGDWLKDLPRVELTGFSDANVDELAERLLIGSAQSHELFRRQINALPHLRTLTRVPLLATLTILIFKGTAQLPASRSTIYGTFIDLLCGGWDLAKGIQRSVTYGKEVKGAILARAATSAHAAGQRIFSAAEFEAACLAAAPGVFVPRDSVDRANLIKGLAQELVEDGLLSRSGQMLHFSHFSFQEFMAARQLSSGTSSAELQNAYRHYVHGSDWWREVLLFVIGLNLDPSGMAAWLANEYAAVGQKGTTSERRQALLLDELSRAFPDFRSAWR